MTGKESTRATDFGQANWGPSIQGYIASIRKSVKEKDFDRIIDEAKKFASLRQRAAASTSSATTTNHDVMDERACLADDSDSDDDM